MKSTLNRSKDRPSVMMPRVIKNDAQYEATLARIEDIFDAIPGTPKGDELELLVLLVETYEDEKYAIDLPDPIAALSFRMEQQQLRPKDLIPYIGNKGKVSEVLSRQRPLSLTMIRKLVAGSLLPAEVALNVPVASPSHPPRKMAKRKLARGVGTRNNAR